MATEMAHVQTSSEDGVFFIRLCRPRMKNALSFEMYEDIMKGLQAAQIDESVAITVITGTGDYFSSGNDFSLLANAEAADFDSLLKRYRTRDPQVFPFHRLMSSLIDHPKPLIALVNGHTVGMAATMIGFFEMVVAADNVSAAPPPNARSCVLQATFHTPFPFLGFCPEGCSSLTFPSIMGYSKACRMLLFGEKIDAAEALRMGYVAKLLPADDFPAAAAAYVKRLAKLPKQTLIASKRLLKDRFRAQLHDANEKECECLRERYNSAETAALLMQRFGRKSKI